MMMRVTQDRRAGLDGTIEELPLFNDIRRILKRRHHQSTDGRRTREMPAPPVKGESSSALRLKPESKYEPTTTEMTKTIAEVLKEKLESATYTSDRASALTREVADAIKAKLREVNHMRFKYVVQVVIGEQRGEGVRMGCRCFWDPETDCYASETYSNDNLFCVATAYAIYLY